MRRAEPTLREQVPRSTSASHWRYVLFALCLVLAACDGKSTATADVILQLGVATRNVEQFGLLTARLESAALHESGQPRGRGWRPLTLKVDELDLVRVAEGGPQIVAEGTFPAGSYDRARIEVSEILGTLQKGHKAQVESIVEPIAVSLSSQPGGGATVHLELTVLSSPADPPDQFKLFVRDGWVGE